MFFVSIMEVDELAELFPLLGVLVDLHLALVQDVVRLPLCVIAIAAAREQEMQCQHSNISTYTCIESLLMKTRGQKHTHSL